MESYDVVVVGAGPTGLMMASELVRYGLKVLIIDKSDGPSTKSKALVIQARTLEILHAIGISERFLERGLPLNGMAMHSKGKQVARVELKGIDSPFPYTLCLPQSETEKLLAEHLHALGLDVKRGFEAVGLSDEGDHVIVKIKESDVRQESVKARFVVGCDGSHSFVRHHLKLEFKGFEFPQVFSLADIPIKWKYPRDHVNTLIDGKTPFVGIPLPGQNHTRLIFQLDRCQKQIKNADLEDNAHVDLPPPTLQEVRELVHTIADPNAEIGDPIWLANFHVNSRLSSQFSKGNIFLAGDSAHIHSPVGGQGMNTGIQDAFNLAWKLAFVHHGFSSKSLLDSYHQERHANAKKLLKGTEQSTAMITLKYQWQRTLRNWIVPKLLKIGELRKQLMQNLSQIAIQYPSSPLFGEDGAFEKGPAVGTRLPNTSLNLHQLLQKSDKFTLLLLTDDTAIGQLFEDTELPLNVHTISEGREALGVSQTGAYLVRPDHVIAYRQTPLDVSELTSNIRKCLCVS